MNNFSTDDTLWAESHHVETKKLRPRFSIMGMPETCTVAYADESYIGFYVRPGPFKAISLSPK